MGSHGKASILLPLGNIGGKMPEPGALLSVDMRALLSPPPNGVTMVCWIWMSLDAIRIGFFFAKDKTPQQPFSFAEKFTSKSLAGLFQLNIIDLNLRKGQGS